MHLRRVASGTGCFLEVLSPAGWVRLPEVLRRIESPLSEAEALRLSTDLVALLGAAPELRAEIARVAESLPPDPAEVRVLMPFQPRTFRDFMLYESHAIDAARGFVRTFMPALYPITRTYEGLTGRYFPSFRPKPLWNRKPIYYMGNPLSFVTDGAAVPRPAYTRALDYELELGVILAHGLYNARAEEAEAAIGGFAVLNDFSARDVQLDEMASGLGPQKAKHFATAISAVVVTADEILPRWQSLACSVCINGAVVSTLTSAGARWSLGEVLAHASSAERLYAGELLGTGTLPGGSGLESGRLLVPGDLITLAIDGVATLTNKIIAE